MQKNILYVTVYQLWPASRGQGGKEVPKCHTGQMYGVFKTNNIVLS